MKIDRSLLLFPIAFMLSCITPLAAQDAFFRDFYRTFTHQKAQGVELSFRSRALDNSNLGETLQQGMLWIKKNKLRLSLGTSTAVVDTQIIRIANDEEQTITYLTPNDEDILALSPILSVEGEHLFKISFLSEKKGRRLYKLTPKKKMEVSYFVVAIDTTQKKLVYVVAGYSNGTRVVNLISGIREKNLDDRFFDFAAPKYRSYEKIDLR